MSVTAAMVKELRERTGAGMMECKKALTETAGDLDRAIELMRKQGLAKADKKAGRVAAEGRVIVQRDVAGTAAIAIEVNCETDFVSGGEEFQSFAAQVAAAALAGAPADVDALLALPIEGGQQIDERRRELVAKIGENIAVRRFERLVRQGDVFGLYSHGSRIGVVVDLKGGDEALARDVAMHIAASRPICISPDDVPAELVAKEREIFEAQARESGKPEDIIQKMVDGRIRKFLNEVALVGQPFVKDVDLTVGQRLKQAGAEVMRFVRLEVGEGVEKKSENFAEEVMAQVRGS
ncbi:MAG TPA: translation elongation factor Ts [Candidatus Acidoferrales bacterium]|nr:translation elongation factor Ts [Candidatus Acidoferrales bacterium]